MGDVRSVSADELRQPMFHFDIVVVRDRAIPAAASRVRTPISFSLATSIVRSIVATIASLHAIGVIRSKSLIVPAMPIEDRFHLQ
jgi:hypothetical protein